MKVETQLIGNLKGIEVKVIGTKKGGIFGSTFHVLQYIDKDTKRRRQYPEPLLLRRSLLFQQDNGRLHFEQFSKVENNSTAQGG